MWNWFRRLIHQYDDYQECGSWGSFNTETGECGEGGKLYNRTIKVKNEDGSVGLESEWITDGEMKEEKMEIGLISEMCV
jgi:hypothetical protein